MANRVPLIVNTSSNQIQELPSGDNLDLTGSGIHNAGVITATSFSGSGANLTGLNIDSTTLKDSGGNVKVQAQASGAMHTGISTFGDIDVDGHTNLDNISVAGVSTFAGAIDANGSLDVDGHTELDHVNVAGIATFNGHRIDISTWVSHVGDTDTRFGFWGPDELTFEAGGTERVHINSSGLQVTNGAGLHVTGVSTFAGNVTIGGTLTYEDVTNIDSVGIITARTSIKLDADGSASSNFLSIGADDDLKIFHQSNVDKIESSANGFHIRQINNGDLHIHAGANTGSSNNRLVARAAGAAELYHSGNKKFETTNTGAVITGICTATSFSGDGSALTGISAGPGTGESYVKLRSTSAASNTGNNTFAGYLAGNALGSSSGDHNTFYGINAGAANNAGQNNVFLGSNAGSVNVGGHENVAIGQAAYSNGTGSKNIAIGRRALKVTTSSDSSVGIGFEALMTQTSGGQSVAIGHQAAKTVTGSQNVAIGHLALQLGENTSHNTIVGAFAGDAITSGEGNTALGRNCLSNLQTGSNNIAIGRGASASSTSVSNEITLGNSSITKFRIPGIDVYAEQDAFLVNTTNTLSTYVQRSDGVWGLWPCLANFKFTASSPGGTAFGKWGNHADGHPLVFVKSRSNGSSGTSCQAGDDLGSILWSPFNSANPGCAAAIKVIADSGTWSSTSNPGYIKIMTAANGDKNPTERLRITSSGTVQPGADATQNLGASNMRWANVYTNDLNLSNEGSSNDVDGTWGKYTIQEGESDLFLINKRNGKKYKFNLTEVS